MLPADKQAPKLVVVFMVGGTTYEEARVVAELNAAGMAGHCSEAMMPQDTLRSSLPHGILVRVDHFCASGMKQSTRKSSWVELRRTRRLRMLRLQHA